MDFRVGMAPWSGKKNRNACWETRLGCKTWYLLWKLKHLPVCGRRAGFFCRVAVSEREAMTGTLTELQGVDRVNHVVCRLNSLLIFVPFFFLLSNMSLSFGMELFLFFILSGLAQHCSVSFLKMCSLDASCWQGIAYRAVIRICPSLEWQMQLWGWDLLTQSCLHQYVRLNMWGRRRHHTGWSAAEGPGNTQSSSLSHGKLLCGPPVHFS